MLMTEAGNRLRSKAIPEAFRGLPITLIYIGVLRWPSTALPAIP